LGPRRASARPLAAPAAVRRASESADGRTLLVAAACIAASVLLILLFGPGAVDSRGGLEALEEGRVADKDVAADREISFVDESATRLRIEAEARLVLPVFVVDAKPAARAVERFRDFQDLLGDLASRKIAGETLYLQVQSAFPGLLAKDEVLTLFRSPFKAQALAFADDILKRLLDQGIARRARLGARGLQSRLRGAALPLRRQARRLRAAGQ
jgi:membrane-associated HD superfamily phosphohydrolase